MNIISFKKLDSTHAYAKQHINLLEDKTIISTDNQIAGYGRFKRSWVDLGKENIYMTFVLKPSDKLSEIYANLTQYLSVCLCKQLEEMGLYPLIKWPNDVLLNNKKVSGILAQAITKKNKLQGIILSIGVNLNASEKNLEKINQPVTAVNIESGQSINKQEFTLKLIENFFENYDEFLEKGFNFIRSDYEKRSGFFNGNYTSSPLEGEGRGGGKSVSHLYTQKALKHAKELRKNMTDAENTLWYYLKKEQMNGVKFRKQSPIGNYIVDFVSFEKKLIIELDGGQHLEDSNIEHDKIRDEFLKNAGYTVLRFFNSEIFENIQGVLEVIYCNIIPPTPNPPPQVGRGQASTPTPNLPSICLDTQSNQTQSFPHTPPSASETGPQGSFLTCSLCQGGRESASRMVLNRPFCRVPQSERDLDKNASLKNIKITVFNRIKEGLFKGFDDNGNLILLTSGGETEKISMGEIT